MVPFRRHEIELTLQFDVQGHHSKGIDVSAAERSSEAERKLNFRRLIGLLNYTGPVGGTKAIRLTKVGLENEIGFQTKRINNEEFQSSLKLRGQDHCTV